MPTRIGDKDSNQAFRRILLRWYRAHRRNLPWRKDTNPYKIWISEIMLQQTQSATVLRYYSRFLERFPDVGHLASASEPEVLKYWSGLGYYSRARNLHKAAMIIVDTHKSFPSEFSAILALPGVGRYTAGAICSIAFNQPYPAVDGNVRRVLSRLSGVRKRAPEKYFWDLMAALLPEENPSEFNQAMMELGALVCIPMQPRCPICPVRGFCTAKRLGLETRIPGIRNKRPSSRVRIVLLILQRNGRVLVSSQREGNLIPGGWGLPWAVVNNGESAERIASDICMKVVGSEIRLEPGILVRHTITHHQITGLTFCGKVEFSRRRCGDGFRWENPSSAGELFTSSVFRKALTRNPEL